MVLNYSVHLCCIFPGFAYHAFIIYSQEDSDWVTVKLLPLLENKHHLKCCVHYRDFAPGQPFQDSMAESVYRSYKIIAVLSSNFSKSSYCSYELNIAKYRLMNKEDNSLIIIRIDNEDCRKLPRELRKRNFIDYANPLERPLWETKLLTFLNVAGDCSKRGNNFEVKCDSDIKSSSAINSRNPSRNEGEEPNGETNMTRIVNPTRPLLRRRSQSNAPSEEVRETAL